MEHQAYFQNRPNILKHDKVRQMAIEEEDKYPYQVHTERWSPLNDDDSASCLARAGHRSNLKMNYAPWASKIHCQIYPS